MEMINIFFNVFSLQDIKQDTETRTLTESPFCCRERLCLISLPQPCRINESLCVFIFSACLGICLEGFVVYGTWCAFVKQKKEMV